MIGVFQVGPEQLDLYGTVPMRLVVESVFRVEIVDRGFGGFRLTEERVAAPWTKDYDEDEPERVRRWTRQFDVSNWAFFLAYEGGELAGGATVAARTGGVFKLDERDDLGALWDIRVRDELRRRGTGRALFGAAVDWCRSQGLRQLKIETQNVNVPACRFYAAMGCELRGIIHHSYAAGSPQLAEEVEFHWWLDL